MRNSLITFNNEVLKHANNMQFSSHAVSKTEFCGKLDVTSVLDPLLSGYHFVLMIDYRGLDGKVWAGLIQSVNFKNMLWHINRRGFVIAKYICVKS